MNSASSKPPPLDYGRTPRRDYVGLGLQLAPFLVFVVCAAIATLGVLLWQDGFPGDRTIGIILAMPSALGAIALPVVIAIRLR